MYNLGIVGRGFVGSAVEFGFSPQTGCDIDNMFIYDKDKSKSLHTLEDVVLYSDIIFKRKIQSMDSGAGFIGQI